MTYISDTLRRQVSQRARGRCEYCRLHQDDALFTHEIDHIYAEKHGGATLEANLCLACFDCNRYKGSDLCSIDPHTQEIISLFHSRHDLWGEHFRLLDTGIIEALTANGRVTERVLKFNRLDLVADHARLIHLGRSDN